MKRPEKEGYSEKEKKKKRQVRPTRTRRGTRTHDSRIAPIIYRGRCWGIICRLVDAAPELSIPLGNRKKGFPVTSSLALDLSLISASDVLAALGMIMPSTCPGANELRLVSLEQLQGGAWELADVFDTAATRILQAGQHLTLAVNAVFAIQTLPNPHPSTLFEVTAAGAGANRLVNAMTLQRLTNGGAFRGIYTVHQFANYGLKVLAADAELLRLIPTGLAELQGYLRLQSCHFIRKLLSSTAQLNLTIAQANTLQAHLSQAITTGGTTMIGQLGSRTLRALLTVSAVSQFPQQNEGHLINEVRTTGGRVRLATITIQAGLTFSLTENITSRQLPTRAAYVFQRTITYNNMQNVIYAMFGYLTMNFTMADTTRLAVSLRIIPPLRLPVQPPPPPFNPPHPNHV
ncbi:hypothetical protein HK097_002150 [Rhizophlyctis rosea]|uniref:Uncharacterized protein n=1 Tax=Rhizophlyctis rosea TaxID=64517 RepID=A0AAD5S3P2_9FUNG|nr:hypothetical protein HK097_002150 [Rhizophlyctis rosea]